MENFYTKHVDKHQYHDGHKYIHEKIYLDMVTQMQTTITECKKRYADDEKFLSNLLHNKIIMFLFAKRIKAQLKKFDNQKPNI